MSDVPRARPALSVDGFAAKLAPVLGNEQALATVQAGMRHLSVRGDRLSAAQQRELLAWLGAQQGMVAAAARHLLRQFDRPLTTPPSGAHATQAPRAPTPTPSGQVKVEGTVSRKQLADMIAGAVSSAKAAEVVTSACRQLGIIDEPLSAKQASEVLEVVARVPGIVGVTARFAKVRLNLNVT